MLSVVIPIYNEEKIVEQTISEIRRVLANEEFEIIAVNDASHDNSKAILNSIEGISVIHHPYNLGYGASLKDGLRKAKGEWVLIIDADGTYPIDHIPKLLKHTPDYDMVVGARESKNVPFIRKFPKWILRKLANYLSGHKIPDLNSGMRVFRKDMAMSFYNLYPQRFSFTTTITLAAHTNGHTVKYVPIPYYKRIGSSSIRPWDFFEFIMLIFRIIMYFNPLKFFFVPGMVLCFVGIIIGIYQVIMLNNIAQTPILFLLGGLQIAFLGLLADLIVKSRR